jgi:hypothetical protein
MSDSNSQGSSKGIGFSGLLTILFIALKLTNVIDWGWFWVLSPLIFSVGLVLIILVIVFIAATKK